MRSGPRRGGRCRTGARDRHARAARHGAHPLAPAPIGDHRHDRRPRAAGEARRGEGQGRARRRRRRCHGARPAVARRAAGCGICGDRWQDAAVIPPVVDADFVADHPEAVLVDVRWYLDGRDGFAAYRDAHLPRARWVDMDTGLAAHGLPATEGRHPLPTPQVFAQAMSELGISDDSLVVAYDDTGGITAGRLVVVLRTLGVDAAVLDGGLAAWRGPVEAGPGQ